MYSACSQSSSMSQCCLPIRGSRQRSAVALVDSAPVPTAAVSLQMSLTTAAAAPALAPAAPRRHVPQLSNWLKPDHGTAFIPWDTPEGQQSVACSGRSSGQTSSSPSRCTAG